MKRILWIAITLILWLGVVLLLELDHRVHSGLFLATFSPLQWFVLSVFIWGLISALNAYILVVRKNLMEVQLKSIMFILDIEDIILCVVPVTHIFILIGNVGFLLHDLMLPVEQPKTPQQTFEEEFMKDTDQTK